LPLVVNACWMGWEFYHLGVLDWLRDVFRKNRESAGAGRPWVADRPQDHGSWGHCSDIVDTMITIRDRGPPSTFHT
jgi:hypothetical protein